MSTVSSFAAIMELPWMPSEMLDQADRAAAIGRGTTRQKRVQWNGRSALRVTESHSPSPNRRSMQSIARAEQMLVELVQKRESLLDSGCGPQSDGMLSLEVDVALTCIRLARLLVKASLRSLEVAEWQCAADYLNRAQHLTIEGPRTEIVGSAAARQAFLSSMCPDRHGKRATKDKDQGRQQRLPPASAIRDTGVARRLSIATEGSDSSPKSVPTPQEAFNGLIEASDQGTSIVLRALDTMSSEESPPSTPTARDADVLTKMVQASTALAYREYLHSQGDYYGLMQLIEVRRQPEVCRAYRELLELMAVAAGRLERSRNTGQFLFGRTVTERSQLPPEMRVPMSPQPDASSHEPQHQNTPLQPSPPPSKPQSAVASRRASVVPPYVPIVEIVVSQPTDGTARRGGKVPAISSTSDAEPTVTVDVPRVYVPRHRLTAKQAPIVTMAGPPALACRFGHGAGDDDPEDPTPLPPSKRKGDVTPRRPAAAVPKRGHHHHQRDRGPPSTSDGVATATTQGMSAASLTTNESNSNYLLAAAARRPVRLRVSAGDRLRAPGLLMMPVAEAHQATPMFDDAMARCDHPTTERAPSIGDSPTTPALALGSSVVAPTNAAPRLTPAGHVAYIAPIGPSGMPSMHDQHERASSYTIDHSFACEYSTADSHGGDEADDSLGVFLVGIEKSVADSGVGKHGLGPLEDIAAETRRSPSTSQSSSSHAQSGQRSVSGAASTAVLSSGEVRSAVTFDIAQPITTKPGQGGGLRSLAGADSFPIFEGELQTLDAPAAKLRRSKLAGRRRGVETRRSVLLKPSLSVRERMLVQRRAADKLVRWYRRVTWWVQARDALVSHRFDKVRARRLLTRVAMGYLERRALSARFRVDMAVLQIQYALRRAQAQRVFRARRQQVWAEIDARCRMEIVLSKFSRCAQLGWRARKAVTARQAEVQAEIEARIATELADEDGHVESEEATMKHVLVRIYRKQRDVENRIAASDPALLLQPSAREREQRDRISQLVQEANLSEALARQQEEMWAQRMIATCFRRHRWRCEVLRRKSEKVFCEWVQVSRCVMPDDVPQVLLSEARPSVTIGSVLRAYQAPD